VPQGAQGMMPRGDAAYPHQQYQQPQGGTGTTLQHTQWGARPPVAAGEVRPESTGVAQYQQHGQRAQSQQQQHQQQYFNPYYGSGGAAPLPSQQKQQQYPPPQQEQKKKDDDAASPQDPWLISDY
jgi:hypothetical protein